MSDAAHSVFNGNGDVAFYFLRGQPFDGGVDLNLIVGDVRDSVNWKGLKTKPPEPHQQDRDKKYNVSICDGKSNKFLDHKFLLVRVAGFGAAERVEFCHAQKGHPCRDNMVAGSESGSFLWNEAS
ncbi:MAG: hypothetical protein KCHDKBKB_02453 [Elusimicrobia bacterium]|nr:hypothetical protein [Elusimicrobiota bacterium]